MFLTTRGLVLREVRYKEADKILTVLTQHEGKITVRARGALRKGSRITAATQLLTYSDMTIFENRGRRTLNEASTVEEFLGLRADLGAFALGSYFAELLETVSAEEYPDPPVLQLGLNSLYALSRALCPPEQIKAVFELRTMSECGFLPQLACCNVCGKYDDASFYLDPQEGYLLCPDCAQKAGKPCNLDAGALYALRHICLVEDKKIFAFKISVGSLAKLSAVAEQYALTHLDKPLKSYSFLKSVLP